MATEHSSVLPPADVIHLADHGVASCSAYSHSEQYTKQQISVSLTCVLYGGLEAKMIVLIDNFVKVQLKKVLCDAEVEINILVPSVVKYQKCWMLQDIRHAD